MAAAFVGTWNMQSSENFDEYMKAVGVNAAMAAIGSTAKPTLIISVEGDTWTLKSETLIKNTKVQFKLGVEFDETTADDRKMKTTFTLDGNKLVQDQKSATAGVVNSVITREVNGDSLTVTCVALKADGNVTAVRQYKKK